MKKVLSFIAISLTIFLLGQTKAFALENEHPIYEFYKEEVENSTYIIGSHMFTREVNDVYDGKLTTKLIMLASKTIEGDALNDMVIYYKNPRGKWVDALSGEEITPPTSFEISNINTASNNYGLSNIDIGLTNIFLSEEVNTKGEKAYYLNFNKSLDINADFQDGIEVYYSTEESGEYTLLRTIAKNEIIDHKVNLGNIEQADSYYYKVRSYDYYYGKIIYSSYSDAFSLVPTPELEIGFRVPEEKTVLWIPIFSNIPDDITGVEVYYKTEEDDEYTLLKTVTKDEIIDNRIETISSSVESTLYFKIRYYKETENKKIYSGFAIEEGAISYTAMYINSDGLVTETKYNPNITEVQYLTPPTKKGYIFIGWTGSCGNTPVKNPSYSGKGKFEFTANWVPVGDVDLDGSVTPQDTVYLSRYLVGGYELPEVVINNISNADVNEDGDIDDVDLAILQKYIADGYIDELPYESGTKYNITYNLDGGVLQTGQYNITTYAEISLPFTLINPTKEGYTFIGWTGSNGNTPQTEVTITETTTGNLEYTANWIANN